MRDVAQGRVVEATVGDTRTEADYLSHVQHLIATDPNAVKWHKRDGLLEHSSIRIVGSICGTIQLGLRSN